MRCDWGSLVISALNIDGGHPSIERLIEGEYGPAMEEERRGVKGLKMEPQNEGITPCMVNAR
jgi:hypothetical protein